MVQNMKKRKYTYVQKWGSYDLGTIVSVGTTIEEIIDYAEKSGTTKKNIKYLKKYKEELRKVMKYAGFFQNLPNGNLIWLKTYRHNPYFYQKLVHELFHAVYSCLGKERRMMEEDEAMAYQQEFLFSEISKKLYDHFKIN